MSTLTEEQPSSGQNGPPLDLTLKNLNDDERKVYDVVWARATDVSIDELARLAFRLKPHAVKANSRVRNALRRLVRSQGVQHGDRRGQYRRGKALGADGAAAGSPPTRVQPGRTGPTASKGEHETARADVTLERIERRVDELQRLTPPHLQTLGDGARKLGIILVAAELLGPKDTAIARLTGYSHGFVIRRLKAFAGQLPKVPTPGFWQPDEFCRLARGPAG